jgi:nicotinamide-nucleotide amidase
MMPMFLAQIAPELPASSDEEALITGKVNLFGIGESLAAERLGDLMARNRNPLIGITISDGIISARVRAAGPPEEMRGSVEADLQLIESRWQPYAFGRDDETLAHAAGRLLQDQRKTLATAESCTGGWLGKAIVDVPGSSAYYLGGWVTYSNEMKTACLSVPGDLLAIHGAVSAEVAQAMAEGALARADADYALAITGIAGPDSDPASNKPVGLVFIALTRREAHAVVRRFEFLGDRSAIRDRSVKAALQMLRFALLGVREDVPMLWQTRVPGAEPIGRI